MKLYTEETIRNLIGRLDPLLRGNDWCELFDSLIPIELPSDDNLEEWIVKYDYEFSIVDIETTKWIIQKIKELDDTRR